ncbi:MAG TPA: bifunctional nuclease domain-containing protein [Pirellulales bacterium]|nr:bifunctional nuclease domain-containing protein [Pirellulales bacterium]
MNAALSTRTRPITTKTIFDLKALIYREDTADGLYYLHESNGSRNFFNIVDSCNAAILYWSVAQRPADLGPYTVFLETLEAFEAVIREVTIDLNKGGTPWYAGEINAQCQDGIKYLRCRASDALILAILSDSPIFVTPEAFRKCITSGLPK